MPRKKKAASEESATATTAQATAEAAAPAERPAYIDGPPVREDGSIAAGDAQEQQTANPYRAVLTTATFELGENRRFKQRVLSFKERPADEVIARLKDAGFTYRPQEKSWTIPANAETRLMTDRLAQELAGPEAGQRR